MKKKRVWCLYRVSGKKQVSKDEDIPMQKKACADFVAKNPDWEITNELLEKGVSGWKKKADDRDEMVAIKEGAAKKEFDVILVFMLDRLGRREDETPLVVQYLIEQGVEVWSVQEGQTKIEHHVDILMNYINFWQSSGESKKTSIRVREAKKQLSEKGYFQGGSAPYGYKIVETDIPHWKIKDRMLKELVIDETEADLVQHIFDMYTNKHMGARKIANYLNVNGFPTREGNLFQYNTIRRILQNPVYIGKKKYVGYDDEDGHTQPQNEKLRIISDDQFDIAMQILNKRRSKNARQDKTGIPLAGKLMFSGLAYCKYCGGKLQSHYRYVHPIDPKTKKVYKVANYRYQCAIDFGISHGEHKQYMFGGIKYDELALKEIKEILSEIDIETYIESSIKQKKKHITRKEKNAKNIEKEIERYNKQLLVLNSEISKVLLGESKFTEEQLTTAINLAETQVEQLTKTFNEILNEIKVESENYSDVNFIANELHDWESKFDSADNDLKKAMLSRVVNKVFFGKNTVEIELNVLLEDCLKTLKEQQAQ